MLVHTETRPLRIEPLLMQCACTPRVSNGRKRLQSFSPHTF
jgi:hypothetical protein